MTRPPASRGPRDLAPLADRLHSAAVHLLRGLRRVDAATGLSAPRLSALSVLVFGGPCTLRALADAEQVRPPTMVRLVQALEQQGLVARQPDPHDRRAIRLRATARGRRLLQRGRARRIALLAGELRTLGDPDRATLARAVDLLDQVMHHLATHGSSGHAPARTARIRKR
ncbi:MAG TPA: MarR family transcriptional regulator [Gemmatimonadales bacterium]|nr:MarR family transcriptional regulator [Gemmatimonadales bacterium]